jgi:hypothetical protein
MEQLMEGVSAQRPLTKSARSSIYQAISQLYQAVPLGNGEFGWLERLLVDNTFRHTLTKTELRRGVIYLDELLHGVFVPAFFQEQKATTRQVEVDLLQGDEGLIVPVGVDRSTWALQMGPDLTRWVDAVGGLPKDDLIIHVDDAVAAHYTLRLQPRESQDGEQLAQRNAQIALAAENFLRQDRKMRPAVPVWELMALLIGKGLFRHPVPPQALHHILTRFSDLHYVESQGYALRTAQRAARSGKVGSSIFASDLDELHALVDSLEDDMADLLSGWDDDADQDADQDIAQDDEESFVDFDPALLGLPDFDESGPCPAYQSYLDAFEVDEREGQPLSHDDFHLLEGELESLVTLKAEFGYLLSDQEARVNQLGERLFLDPSTLLDDLFDDYNDDMGWIDGPPFWEN